MRPGEDLAVAAKDVHGLLRDAGADILEVLVEGLGGRCDAWMSMIPNVKIE